MKTLQLLIQKNNEIVKAINDLDARAKYIRDYLGKCAIFKGLYNHTNSIMPCEEDEFIENVLCDTSGYKEELEQIEMHRRVLLTLQKMTLKEMERVSNEKENID